MGCKKEKICEGPLFFILHHNFAALTSINSPSQQSLEEMAEGSKGAKRIRTESGVTIGKRLKQPAVRNFVREYI